MIKQKSNDYTSVYRNKIFELETSIYISKDERILFDNCTIIATQDYCNIIVKNGGFLKLENTYIRSIEEFEWYFISHEGSIVELIDCMFYAGYITKELIHISGFDSLVQNCSFFNQPKRAIKVHEAQKTILTHNNISGSNIGIEVAYASEVTIFGNLFESNGDAIDVIQSSDIYIKNNSIFESSLNGIFVDTTNNSIISCNTIASSNENAIYVCRTKNATLSNNLIIQSNRSGIRFFECIDSNIQNNTLENCHSLLVQYTEDITISSNSVYYSSGDGIEIYRSGGIDIVLNDIIMSKGWGLSCTEVENVCIFGNIINRSMLTSMNFWESSGRVFVNALIQPSSDLISGTELGFIEFCNAKYGNYYASYQGEDDDGDLIADEPYTIEFGIQDLYPIMSVDVVISMRESINYKPPSISLNLEIYHDMSNVTIVASTNSSIEIMRLNYSIDSSNIWNVTEMTKNECGWSTDIMIGSFSVIQFEIIVQDFDGNINSTNTFDYELQPPLLILSNLTPILKIFVLIIFPIGVAFLLLEKIKERTLMYPYSQYLVINLQRIFSNLTIDRCWKFLDSILNREMYSVIYYLFNEFLQDLASDYSLTPYEYGWRNKYQIHMGAKVSKRQIYSQNGVMYSLLKNTLISENYTSCNWGGQRFKYRINIENLIFQIMLDLS